jgi:hypothetical protein
MKTELRPGVAVLLFVVGLWAGMAVPLVVAGFDVLGSPIFQTMFGIYFVVAGFGLEHIGEKKPAPRAAFKRWVAGHPYLAVLTGSAVMSLFATTVACGYAALHWPTWAQVVLTIPAGLYLAWRPLDRLIRST